MFIHFTIIKFTFLWICSSASCAKNMWFSKLLLLVNKRKQYFDHSLSILSSIPGSGQGPVVQSVVSLTSSLRIISLTVLADLMYNILIFFAEKNVSSFCTAKATHIFSAKNFRIFAYHSIKILTNR